MTRILLAPEFLLARPEGAAVESARGVLVQDDRIAAVGPIEQLRAEYPAATLKGLRGCLLMAGFVNAHQHGRGLSQIQLGYPDDFLEAWIARRRGRGAPDPFAVTRLAAMRMAANGVTCAVHANYSYGSGDYEAEVRAQIRAYLEVGIRVTLCIGAMDRGAIAYPPHEACFCSGLPPQLSRWLAESGRPAYMKDAAVTIDLMHRLRAEFADEERVRFCYGPAGPQWVSDELWSALAADARAIGVGLHLHALESPAQRDAARELYPEGVFRRLDALGVLDARCVLAHGVWLEADDIDLIARRGATVVRNPGSNLRLRNGIAPLPAMLERGVRVAVGTDNAACDDSEDLLGELRMADLLARTPDWNGLPPASTASLLAMLTTNGAVAAGYGDLTGTIEAGRLADLVAIRLDNIRDPWLDPDMTLARALVSRGSGRDVVLTMVGGRVVFEAGRFSGCDREEVEQTAAQSAARGRLPSDPEAVVRALRVRDALETHYRVRNLATSAGVTK